MTSPELPAELPSPVVRPDLGMTVGEFWRARLAQHLTDYYCGLRISKFPEDLRVYEQLLWMQRPDAVVEIGCQFGASSLWFADRLDTLRRYGGAANPLVIAIDIDVGPTLEALDRADRDWRDRIRLIEADVTSPELPDLVRSELGGRMNCMVVEDSAHEFDTTAAALRGFSGFVPPGGFFVVEDGVVDVAALRLDEGWPRGVLPAVDQFLSSPDGDRFVLRPELEMYGITCHPGGYLQRLH